MTSVIFAVLSTCVLIAVLGWRDPKRLRNRSHPRHGTAISPLSLQWRRLLGWLVPLPGAMLALFGQWWPFLIWFGASCTAGWLTAQLLGGRGAPRS